MAKRMAHRTQHNKVCNSKSIRKNCFGTAEIEDCKISSTVHNKNDNANVQEQEQCEQRSQTLVVEIAPAKSKFFHDEVLDFAQSGRTPRLGPQLIPSSNYTPHHFNFNTAHSSTGSSPKCTSFTLFPKLPLELQFKIWKLAAFQGQVVGVRDLEGKAAFCGTSARCSLMLACKQSRQEVMRVKKNVNALDLSSTPKVYSNLAVDTIWLSIERMDIYDRKAPVLWQKIVNRPTRNVRKLAISYSLWKRRWGDMNAMVLKLDLEELILLVDTEEVSQEEIPVFIKPRSAVGRRSTAWNDWDDLTRSEVRQLQDCLSHAQHSYKRIILKGASAEELLKRGKRDLTHFKIPRILIRDVVNSRNALPEELAAIAEEENDDDEHDKEFDTDSEEGFECE